MERIFPFSRSNGNENETKKCFKNNGKFPRNNFFHEKELKNKGPKTGAFEG